jgi:hypothetical protein
VSKAKHSEHSADGIDDCLNSETEMIPGDRKSSLCDERALKLAQKYEWVEVDCKECGRSMLIRTQVKPERTNG